MKKFFRRLFHNATNDLLTSVAGCIAGSDDLMQGIVTNNSAQIIKGSAIIFLGLITKSNESIEIVPKKKSRFE